MARRRMVHRCTECGAESPRWAGRCGTCGEWNTLVEEVEDGGGGTGSEQPVERERPVPLAEVDAAAAGPRPTGLGELDRVLGGGLVPGSVTLLGGEPGIGKSTLVLQAMAVLAASGARCLLVCAEESPQQVKRRATRLGALAANVWLVGETSLPGIRAAVDELAPNVMVVDSIQTVWDPEVDAGPGSVSQVRGCAHQLVQLAKSRDLTTVLVGHVTKEGSLAGPRVLEHVVDTVLTFEGERHHALRLLRAVKHRFGPAGELGLFEMTDAGLVGVPDPSGLFLGDRRAGAAGSAVFPAMEGQRPLLVEIQALVSKSSLAMPRRSASGLDSGRLALLVAVLERRTDLSLVGADIYASAVGGVRVAEPGADLALCLALASAATGQALPADLVACGEVGLAGEIRQVSRSSQRLAEAARLGFGRALVPASAPVPSAPIAVNRVATLAEAVRFALSRDNQHGTVIDIGPRPLVGRRDAPSPAHPGPPRR
jgi:DNA repair protein RadA/Sms